MASAYEIQFCVIDSIVYDAKLIEMHPELRVPNAGVSFVLDPAYAPVDHELVGAQAEVTSLTGEVQLLNYDFYHVGANDVLALFFCNPNIPDIKRLSKVRFIKGTR